MSTSTHGPCGRLLARADHFFANEDFESAHALFEATQWAAELAGDWASEARALTQLGWIAHYRCDLSGALEAFGKARDRYESSGDVVNEAHSATRLAFAEYEHGVPEAAADLLDRVDRTRAGLEGVIVGYEGSLARSVGDLSLARARYRAAVALLPADHVLAQVFAMEEAIVDLLEGHAADAERRLSVLAASDSGAEPVFFIYRRHYRVLCAAMRFDLTSWEERHSKFDAPDSPMATDFEATHRIAGCFARGEPRPDLESTVPSCEQVRLSLRILRRAFERRDASRGRRILRLNRAPATMQLDGGAPSRFRRESPAWRILCALVEAGAPVAPETLIAVGWPGEKILPKAARNRLHVTLAGLRRRGLEDDLHFDGRAYAFSESLEIVGTTSGPT